MPAPLIGLPALLQAIATISVGGAVGYKAKKDLEPLIKELQSSPKNLDSTELRMLRALLLPNQALASELKDMTTSKSVGTTGEGAAIGPRAEDIEKVQEEIKQVTKPPVTKTPIKPITTESFPAEPQQKPEPPIQPEIDFETKETFPDQSEKLNIPIITYYNKDDELIKEGLGRYEEVYSEQDFKTANKNLPELSVKNNKKIVEADKHFGAYALNKDFDTTRLIYLTPKQFLNLSNDFDENSDWSKARIDYLTEKLKQGKEMGEIPALFVGKEGNNYIVRGHEGRHRASAFLNAGYDKIPVRIQGISKEKGSDIENKLYTATPESNVGKQPYSKEFANFIPEKIISERIREDRSLSGEVDFSVELKPDDFFDVITKEKLFSKTKAPAIVGTMAQEGGKQIKDITAGFSIQKDVVPSLLEQGKAAIPMKNFFEKDTNVVNYKVGDTIGAYGGDVERSLDIEANVKPNFDLNSFSEVIKQGAKEYNQDAVFVAESAPLEKANTVGFSLDFGSNLNIADALEVSKRISDTAQLDGFTFKIKNLDTSGASIYLPQEIDLEMTKKVIDKFKPTDQINLAGFIMPDGTMLNFSNNGKVRDTEHRRIGLITHPGSDGISFGPMYDFMNKTGAIRLAGNTNRLYAEISGKPSTTQIRKIADEYNKNRNKYDSLTIALAIPKTEGALQGVKPEEAIDLNKMTYRLPNEAFIEINGTKANANEIYKKFQAADVMGKTFTGIRQLNIPEFSNMSAEEAAQKIVNLGNNMSKVIEETGIKTLDKPESKSYNVKVFKKGKDY